MRVYLPATLSMVMRLVSDGQVAAVGGTAFALTPALREAYAAGDEEELAEVALAEAALASIRLLAGDPDARPRRAVLVADVDDDVVTLRPDLDDAVVRLAGPVTMVQVAAGFVDNSAAEPAVTAAIAVIDAADLGDEDAELTVGDAQDCDLAWYGTQELPFLVDLL